MRDVLWWLGYCIGRPVGLMIKLYQSKKWLTKKYVHEKWSEEEIADYCNTNQSTINRWLNKFGLKRKK